MDSWLPIVVPSQSRYNWFERFEAGMRNSVKYLSHDMLFTGPGLARHYRLLQNHDLVYHKAFQFFCLSIPPMCLAFVKGPTNVFDLGVGPFDKARNLLQTLCAAENGPPIHYYPVDISFGMLFHALRSGFETRTLTKSALRDGSVTGILADITVPMSLDEFRADNPSIFLLLGNTLANSENEVDVLKGIAELMQDGDLLVVELLQVKKQSEFDSQRYTNDVHRLYFGGPFLALGCPAKHVFHVDMRTSESSGVFKKTILCSFDADTALHHPLLQRKPLMIHKGEEVVVCLIREYTEVRVRELFVEAGFSEVKIASDSDHWFFHISATRGSAKPDSQYLHILKNGALKATADFKFVKWGQDVFVFTNKNAQRIISTLWAAADKAVASGDESGLGVSLDSLKKAVNQDLSDFRLNDYIKRSHPAWGKLFKETYPGAKLWRLVFPD